MYLFVFVLLLVSILGLYMDAFLIQVGRIAKEQTVVAAVMLDWHDGAFATAKANPAQTNCILTSGVVFPVGIAACGTTIQTVQGNSGYALPSGYQTGTYQFPSVVFTRDSIRYVLTYIPYENPANDTVRFSAGGITVSLGHTVGDIFDQMQKLAPDPRMYGMIQGGRLLTRAIEPTNGSSINYDLPAQFAAFQGVGFISRVQ